MPVIGILQKRGALPISEVGEVLGISKSNMTAIIEKINLGE